MVDVLTPTQRSYNMSMIRSKNTGPEAKLADLLISKGVDAFTMHPKEIFGKPDFYFPKHKVALFLDGCFWHGCNVCFRTPATNKEFWTSKIASNIQRGKLVNRQLRKEKVTVIRIKEHQLKSNPSYVLTRIRRTLQNNYQPKVLDLFAGAGGFSEGFIHAGCEMIAHIEMDKDACETIRTRMVYHALKSLGRLSEYKKYLLGKKTLSMLVDEYSLHKEYKSVMQAKIDRDTCTNLIKEVEVKLKGESLDIIIGGPPCQAYSNIGHSSDRKRMRRDERKSLYIYYVEFLKAFKPKIFVFENVPGLLSARNSFYLRKMRRLMKEAGYKTDLAVLNAAKYGVPQERKRMILVGWRKDSGLTAYPEFQKVERNYGIADFLNDLPALSAGEGEARKQFKSSSVLLRKLEIVNPD